MDLVYKYFVRYEVGWSYMRSMYGYFVSVCKMYGSMRDIEVKYSKYMSL